MSALKTSTLGELVTIAGGGTPTRSNPDFYGGTIPWVTPKDMKSWEITGAQVTLTQSGVENSSTRVVPINSILIVVRSGVLKHTIPVGLNRVPVAINQDMKALQCREGIDANYLARFVKASSPIILQWVRATTADNFPIDKLRNLAVPLPTLTEQRRIAEVLDRAEALRAKRRAALAQLDSLTQSLFLDLFGDPVFNPKRIPKRPLGEMIRVKSGDSVLVSELSDNGEFPVYGGNGINGYHTRFMFESPIIVIGRVGVYCGVVHITKPNAWVTDNALFVTDISPELDLPYLAQALTIANLNQYAGRAAQPLVSGSRIYPVEILVPQIELQREFARRVTAVETLKTAQRASLAELDALFASLQHRAFRGEL